MRLVLSVSLLLIVLLTASSAVLYVHTERTVLDIQQSASEKMLGQTIYNLDSMNEILKTTIISSYYDTDVSDFIYADLRDTYTLYQHLAALERMMKAAPFLHSIVIFNERNQCYYSYSPSAIQACQPDGGGLLTARYVAEHPSLPKLTLLPVSAALDGGERRPIDYFSYAMYSDKPTGGQQKGMLILNVRPDWLFAQLSGINRLKDSGTGRMLLMNGAGELYDPSRRSWSAGGELYESVLREMSSSGKNADLYVHGAGGNKEIVSYMQSENYDWVVVSVQPYAQVFRDILRMRTVSFYIIAIFLALALAASAAVALRLYHPIEILLRKVRGSLLAAQPESGADRRDELAYISSAFDRTLEQVHLLERSQDDQGRILRDYALKTIVLESAVTAPEEMLELIRHHRLRIVPDLPYVLFGFHADDIRPQQADPVDRLAYAGAHAVPLIAAEALEPWDRLELIGMENGCTIAIAGLSGPDGADREELMTRARAVQALAQARLGLSLTVTVSPLGLQLEEMSGLYARLLDYANYRMIAGRMAFLTPEQLGPNLHSGQFLSSPELERRLSEAVKAGHEERVYACLAEWFRSLCGLKYEQMLYGMFHLLGTLHKLVEEINANRLHPVALDTREMYGLLAEVDTLEEAEQLFRDRMGAIVAGLNEPGGEQTHQLVAQTVHEIIHTRYMDANLCLPEIASMVRLSSAHVSKLFKMKYGAGIPDYLNEVRLQQAIVLLSQQDYSVNQIMERVGFTNQSYFFRLFKKRYGTTPKEYRLRQVL